MSKKKKKSAKKLKPVKKPQGRNIAQEFKDMASKMYRLGIFAPPDHSIGFYDEGKKLPGIMIDEIKEDTCREIEQRIKERLNPQTAWCRPWWDTGFGAPQVASVEQKPEPSLSIEFLEGEKNSIYLGEKLAEEMRRLQRNYAFKNIKYGYFKPEAKPATPPPAPSRASSEIERMRRATQQTLDKWNRTRKS